MTTPTPADAVRAAIVGLRHNTDEGAAAIAIRVAADTLLPLPAADDRSPQADRDRLLRLQFLALADELAGNPPPAASWEALAEAREESQDRSQLSDGYHTFAELYEHRHALMLALMRSEPDLCWFSRYHADGGLPFGSPDWFIAGAELTTGPITYHLPARLWETAQKTGASELSVGMAWDGHTPADVVERLKSWAAWLPASREESQAAAWQGVEPEQVLPAVEALAAAIEPTPFAPALPPSLVLDGGDGVRIEATNHERSSWAIRDGNWCLTFSGIWECEPYASSRDAGYLARARWPSAEAAWAALLENRDGEEVER
jgi:hypothetical protein